MTRAGRAGVSLSNWRGVRLWEDGARLGLRRRHRLWLHGWCIGLIVLAAMWAASHLQMLAGSDSLALRYFVTLGVGYLVYLLVLRVWAGMLVNEDSRGGDGGLDFLSGVDGVPLPGGRGSEAPQFEVGGGGEFAGGGASGDFSGAADAPGEALGQVASGAIEAAGAADEGAVVLVPVAAVFIAGVAALLGAGSLLLLYFGWEVLLAAAVEIAFSYVSARTAVRVVREGWLSAVVRLTWKPLLGAAACALALGAVVDLVLPQARSLPHAVELLRTQR